MPTQRPRRPSQPGERPGDHLTIRIPIPGSLLLLVAGVVVGAVVTGALTLSLDRGQPVAETRSQQRATPATMAAAGQQQPGAQQPPAAQPPAGDDDAGAAGPPAASAPPDPPGAAPLVMSWSAAPLAPPTAVRPLPPAPPTLVWAPANRPSGGHIDADDGPAIQKRSDRLVAAKARKDVADRDEWKRLDRDHDRDRWQRRAEQLEGQAQRLERRADQLQRRAERLEDRTGRRDGDNRGHPAKPAKPVLAPKPVAPGGGICRGSGPAVGACPLVSAPLQPARAPGAQPAKHAGQAGRSHR